MTEQGSSEVV